VLDSVQVRLCYSIWVSSVLDFCYLSSTSAFLLRAELWRQFAAIGLNLFMNVLRIIHRSTLRQVFRCSPNGCQSSDIYRSLIHPSLATMERRNTGRPYPFHFAALHFCAALSSARFDTLTTHGTVGVQYQQRRIALKFVEEPDPSGWGVGVRNLLAQRRFHTYVMGPSLEGRFVEPSSSRPLDNTLRENDSQATYMCSSSVFGALHVAAEGGTSKGIWSSRPSDEYPANH
jgi:hypothetical protein